jgi:hypothetical protein
MSTCNNRLSNEIPLKPGEKQLLSCMYPVAASEVLTVKMEAA